MGRRIGQRKLVVLTSVANAIGLVVFALFGAYITLYPRAAIACLLVGLICGFVAPVLTGLYTVHTEEISATLHERQRALGMFTEVTHGMLKLDASQELRVTLLEVDNSPNPARLVQRVRCENGGQKKVGNTWMYTHQGVAGRCYREEKLFTVNFSAGDFIQQMIALGFHKDEAQQFEARGAYLCSPIFSADEKVIGVLSIDAKDANAFLPEHNEIAEWVTPFFARFLTEPEGGST
ncbi:MAG: hypothetical protein ABR577_04495 [Pyrinomonadaceae bacterium]